MLVFFCISWKCALKASQGNQLEDVQLYFTDAEFLGKSAYKKTIEKARGKIEKR